MKVSPDIICHEFIGTEGKIVKSNHSDYIGIHGEVLDETKHTFKIMHKGKAKSVIKNLTIFNFRLSDGTIVEIDGKLLIGRPEDRLKKNIKRLW